MARLTDKQILDLFNKHNLDIFQVIDVIIKTNDFNKEQYDDFAMLVVKYLKAQKKELFDAEN